ncbi:MAG TPA: alpha-amylase family glycosyl hydrolase, partial [Candidatus Angelobacter sp.]|nr:alpha-amylase family glycosyl hydrolase [Candidatus Angelobacter sp.]
ALEELMMLWLANLNPAFKPCQELFDDQPLVQATAYSSITAALREYFEKRPKFGPDNQNLIDMLRAPALASPGDLAGQLAFIQEKWKSLLGDFMSRLLTALDVLREEQVAVWMRFHPPADSAVNRGPGWDQRGDSSERAVPQYRQSDHEYEQFSPDVDWMPRTVMLAKSTYVWLDQLSKQYGRNIHRLDQVPDEEIETMARRGFNSLWLIGLWERSRASEKVKRMCGSTDAVASAYSLLDYAIAEDIGGESAYKNLKDRAGKHGIRLASDMVPNHMAIDSRWVMEHPDWFLSLPHPPYPSYSFEGPDVSGDSRVEIKIEDHYFNRSDASVVFRRRDRWTGDTRYVYHGNDGTSFPWNDTAQLDYLRADVREAVIQTILHVARMFPIIRFDAAMTLTKLHYQRLWFPQPGTGGAIPSRAEHGMTKEEFDRHMPREFWRELVDRVAAEVPDTLLLAEAFWLLEGYFVRTLGMHRVYNSAFMNMLRDEENANYRSVIKNTLEFDPEVLKRYVNFMNNPDERTAVDQFGKGDKYFGVCTLMVTMPGLPMFGHGQVEGYTEKYGMDFRRPRLAEQPDSWLMARHEREISPLLHRRGLFAEVENFLLYDFYTDSGHVNEDVYAYSNHRGEDRALVLFHNRYADTRGWIRVSAGYMDKTTRDVRQRTLGEAFGFSSEHSMLVAFRDALSGLEFLHRAADLTTKGLRFELGAYKSHVFLDWRDIRDDGVRPWSALCDLLAGRGVASLDDALRDLELKPVHDSFRALLDPELMKDLADILPGAPAEPDAAEGDGDEKISLRGRREESEIVRELSSRVRAVLHESRRYLSTPVAKAAGLEWERQGDFEQCVSLFARRIESASRLPLVERQFVSAWPEGAAAVIPGQSTKAEHAVYVWSSVVVWAALEAAGRLCGPENSDEASALIFAAMRLRETIADVFAKAGSPGDEHWRAAERIHAVFAHTAWAPAAESAPAIRSSAVLSWLHDPGLAWLIGVHEWEGVRYFNKENFEHLLWWMSLRALLAIASSPSPDPVHIALLEREIRHRLQAASDGGYRVEVLLQSGLAEESSNLNPADSTNPGTVR